MSKPQSSIQYEYFEILDPVEVNVEQYGSGNWYTGTIVDFCESAPDEVVVEFDTLTDGEPAERMTERAYLDQLRPVQPSDYHDGSFRINDHVDAFYCRGWWEGVITEISGDEYFVKLKANEREPAFEPSKLRVHRDWDWVSRNWNPPISFSSGARNMDVDHQQERPSPHANGGSPDAMNEVPLPTAAQGETEQTEFGFSPGQLIEVATPKEGYEGAWFYATVVRCYNDGQFLVEYEEPQDDGQTLSERVHGRHIRPRLPKVTVVDGYEKFEAVEALWDDGWWVGEIKKVLRNNKYLVYIRNTKEKIEFHHSQLRVHLKWKNGKWSRPDQGRAFDLI